MRAAKIGTGETVSTTNARHHTPYHHWKTACSSCPKVSPSACRGSLSRVTLWFPWQTLNYWFDILHQTITWKMWETETPLYISLSDLTKAFDLVSRVGIFKNLPKFDCPTKILGIIKSFHNDQPLIPLIWFPSYLDSSSSFCWNTPLDLQLKECTSERDLMVNSSALPDGKPRPRFVRSAYATSFAPMMQQRPHTLRIKYNNTWIALALPASISDLLSTWRKHK